MRLPGCRLQARGSGPVGSQADARPRDRNTHWIVAPGWADRLARPRLVISAALCGLTLMVVVGTMRSEVDAMAPPAEHPVPFKVGETLEYDVGWSSYLTAGTATLSIREKKPSYGSVAYYAVAEGRATGLVAALYHVYYKADTLLDVYSLLPQRGSIFGQEGRRRRQRVTQFDQAKRTARYEVTPGGGPQRPIALPGPTHDALSAVLALRMLRLREGFSVTPPALNGDRVFEVQATVRARERLSTRLGQVMAWRVEPVIVGDTGEI